MENDRRVGSHGSQAFLGHKGQVVQFHNFLFFLKKNTTKFAFLPPLILDDLLPHVFRTNCCSGENVPAAALNTNLMAFEPCWRALDDDR